MNETQVNHRSNGIILGTPKDTPRRLKHLPMTIDTPPQQFFSITRNGLTSSSPYFRSFKGVMQSSPVNASLHTRFVVGVPALPTQQIFGEEYVIRRKTVVMHSKLSDILLYRSKGHKLIHPDQLLMRPWDDDHPTSKPRSRTLPGKRSQEKVQRRGSMVSSCKQSLAPPEEPATFASTLQITSTKQSQKRKLTSMVTMAVSSLTFQSASDAEYSDEPDEVIEPQTIRTTYGNLNIGWMDIQMKRSHDLGKSSNRSSYQMKTRKTKFQQLRENLWALVPKIPTLDELHIIKEDLINNPKKLITSFAILMILISSIMSLFKTIL